MAQTQQKLTLSRTPVSITDGTNSAHVTSIGGDFSYAVGDTAPDPNSDYWHQNSSVSVGIGPKLWICSQSSANVQVRVSIY
jgi:hypothetical protein